MWPIIPAQQPAVTASSGGRAAVQSLNEQPLSPAAVRLSICALALVVFLFTISPLYAAAAAILIGGCVALPYLSIRPEYFIYAAAGLTSINLSDVLIQRFGLPSTAKIVVILTVIALAISLYGGRARPIFPRVATQILAIYAACAGLAIFSAYDQVVALAAFSSLLQELALVAMFLIIVQDIDVLRNVARALMLALALVAALGIVGMMMPERGFDFFGFANIEIATIVGDYDSGRLTGPFTDPNSYSRILLIAFPFACLELAEKKSLAARAAALAAPVAIGGAIVLTFSRGALVALFVTSCVMLWNYRDRLLRLAAFIIPCGALLLAVAPDEHMSRIYTIFGSISGQGSDAPKKDESIQYRTEEMAAAVHMFLDHPVFGVGYRNYPEMFQKYTLEQHYTPRHEDRLPHCRYLEVASEQGLVGLMAFAMLCGWALLVSFRSRHGLGQHGRLAGAIGLSLTGYLIASTFLHEDYSRVFWLMIGMALALPQCVQNLSENRQGYQPA